jgi:plasmid maintenance system antidote protein VapI
MALRLSKTLGRTPESWLAMQDKYSLWWLSQSLKLDDVETIEISA